MRVTCILPCYGRVEQTLELIRRLLQTEPVNVTGLDANEWELICFVNGEQGLGERIKSLYPSVRVINSQRNIGYWRALKVATSKSTAPLLVNLANDLLPSYHWLRKALTAFDGAFTDGIGLLGFNDGIRTDQSAHMLVSRALLEKWYGHEYWPTMYEHSFGDTELCQRARAMDKYVVAPYAVLFHNHAFNGAPSDIVYGEGRATMERDKGVYEMRRANEWGAVTAPSEPMIVPQARRG